MKKIQHHARALVILGVVSLMFVGISVQAAVSTFADGLVIGGTSLAGGLLVEVEGQIGAQTLCNESGGECSDISDIYAIQSSGISGSGSINRVPYFVDSATLGNSTIRETGSGMGIGVDPVQSVHVAGNVRTDGRRIYLGNQTLYGDNSSALYFDSNHSEVTQLLLRDTQSTIYGRVFGTDNGVHFGMLDTNDHWFVLSNKDNYTQWRISDAGRMWLDWKGLSVGLNANGAPEDVLYVLTNNNESVEGVSLTSPTAGWLRMHPDVSTGAHNSIVQSGDVSLIFSGGSVGTGGLTIAPHNDTDAGMRINAQGKVGIGDPSVDGGLTLDVEGAVGASGYCDAQGSNCFYLQTLLMGQGPEKVGVAPHGAVDDSLFVFSGLPQEFEVFGYPNVKSYADAQTHCQSLGGHLASVEQVSEQNTVHAVSRNYVTWLGASDALSEGTWVWEDGSPWSYTNWAPGEPNGGTGHNCLYVRTDGSWDDGLCSFAISYMCEFAL